MECRVPQRIGLPAFPTYVTPVAHAPGILCLGSPPGVHQASLPQVTIASTCRYTFPGVALTQGTLDAACPVTLQSSQFSVESGWQRVWAAPGEGSLRYLGACLMCEESWEVWCQVTLRVELPCDLSSSRF